MRVTDIKIQIGKFAFSYVHNVEASTDWENLTNTCVIKLPANLSLNVNKLRDLIRPGDKVEINAGYDANLNLIFKGYVAAISPTTPIELRCEDEMYLLKQSTINDHLYNCKLSTLLKRHFNDIAINFIDAEIGDFRIENMNRAKVLDKLKEWGIHSFFRQGVLVVGKPYDATFARKIVYHITGTKCNVIDDNLEYRRASDIKLRVTAISLYPDGSRKEVKIGDEGGENRTLNYYNLSVNELSKAAQRHYERMVYDGYRGSFTTFIEPFVRQGDIVVLKSVENSDRTGEFWVDKVTYRLGTDGFRQEIKIGPKA